MRLTEHTAQPRHATTAVPPEYPKDQANSRVARFIWESRYRRSTLGRAERDIGETWHRVACAAASVERDRESWTNRFLETLLDYRFLPAGRILAGAGTDLQVTLANCFVMGPIQDSIEGIFEALKEGAITMQQGGGVGYDFSTLRPRGALARTSGVIASGPVSFMRVWDAMCATVLSTGARRGAMMGCLRCDHPDIEEFIAAKRSAGALQYFNLSVLLTDAFMQAVREDQVWPLVFPDTQAAHTASSSVRYQPWSGSSTPVPCRVYRTVQARELWTGLCQSAYESAEPGVLFVDRINAMNNLGYAEQLSATNPCAEEPLPAYGACHLGSINLCALVRGAFSPAATLPMADLEATTRTAVRFLDDVIDISRFPLPQQEQQARHSRRIGIGITGLADALIMLGLNYGEAPARDFAAGIMRRIRDVAYETSVQLADEKGPFPGLDRARYLQSPFVAALPQSLQAGIAARGIRNSHLLAIAPAGSISLLAENVSSGIEPVFGIESVRRIRDPEGSWRSFRTTDYAYALWQAGHAPGALPIDFVCADRIAPRDQLLMQSAVQAYVDGAVSKTIALPSAFQATQVPELIEMAYDLGVKGCTVYRTEARAGVIAATDT